MRKTTSRIIVHCSATRPEWMYGQGLGPQVAEIRRWHTQDRGWRDIGYHRLIGRDGERLDGRGIMEVGAHVAGHNHDSIGVCLIGGHGSGADDDFLDNFTPAQEEALALELLSLRDRFGPLTIHGHNEFAAKACPGFRVARWLQRRLPLVLPAVV